MFFSLLPIPYHIPVFTARGEFMIQAVQTVTQLQVIKANASFQDC